jgi:hypothetical protein
MVGMLFDLFDEVDHRLVDRPIGFRCERPVLVFAGDPFVEAALNLYPDERREHVQSNNIPSWRLKQSLLEGQLPQSLRESVEPVVGGLCKRTRCRAPQAQGGQNYSCDP